MEQGGREDGRDFWGLTETVIGALIEVHRCLGPGLLESAYEACFCVELERRGLSFERQRPVRTLYKGIAVECGYRVDVVVSGTILVELKAIERLLPVHEAQVITYLRLSGLPVGLLVNFNTPTLCRGLRRLTPHPPKTPSRPPPLPVKSHPPDHAGD